MRPTACRHNTTISPFFWPASVCAGKILKRPFERWNKRGFAAVAKGRTGGAATVNAVSLKLKYASTAFVAVLLAAVAFVGLFAWQLHLHSQHVETLAQAAVHANATPGVPP